MLALAVVSVAVAASPAVTTPECRSSQLRVSLGRSEGAAGSLYVPLVFTNVGGRACHLRGFPGVSSVAGASGRQVGAPARRTTDIAVRTVLIRPRHSASALYRQANSGNYPRSLCRPEQTRGLRIYPPDERAALFLPWPHRTCSIAGARDSSIGPVQPGVTAGQ